MGKERVNIYIGRVTKVAASEKARENGSNLSAVVEELLEGYIGGRPTREALESELKAVRQRERHLVGQLNLELEAVDLRRILTDYAQAIGKKCAKMDRADRPSLDQLQLRIRARADDLREFRALTSNEKRELVIMASEAGYQLFAR